MPGKVERYGYGKYPNVLTALEFERLTNASGPTGGKIVTKTKQFNKRLKKDEWVVDTADRRPKAWPSFIASDPGMPAITPIVPGSAACIP